jgi:hypothetical protein
VAPLTSANVVLLAEDCHWNVAAPYPVAGANANVAVPDTQIEDVAAVAVTVAGNTVCIVVSTAAHCVVVLDAIAIYVAGPVVVDFR